MLKDADQRNHALSAAKFPGANVKLLAQVDEPEQVAPKRSKVVRNSTIAGGVTLFAVAGVAALAFSMKKAKKQASHDEYLLQ